MRERKAAAEMFALGTACRDQRFHRARLDALGVRRRPAGERTTRARWNCWRARGAIRLPAAGTTDVGDRNARPGRKGLGVDVEVWSYGRTPLAMSGRCYHARAHGLTKDSCQFVCANDYDGLQVDTLDGQPFLAVNGVQTMSFNLTNLAGDITALGRAGVASLRLSPQSGDFVSVCRVFRDRVDGAIDAGEAMARLAADNPAGRSRTGSCWAQRRGIDVGACRACAVRR